jgi:hypothetical protein
MLGSPGLRLGDGYEASSGGTAFFPCTITDKVTEVVSYTVKFDNGESKTVEAGAVHAVGRKRARTETKRPEGSVDPTSHEFDGAAASAARSSPAKKRRSNTPVAKGTLNKETRIYTAAKDQTPAMIAEHATFQMGYASAIDVDTLIAVNEDVPNHQDMKSYSKLEQGTQITIPDEGARLSQAQ